MNDEWSALDWFLFVFILVMLIRMVAGYPKIRAMLVAAAARHVQLKQRELYDRGYALAAGLLVRAAIRDEELNFIVPDAGPFEKGMQAAFKDFYDVVKRERIKGPDCPCRQMNPPAVCDTCETREQYEARTQVKENHGT